MPPMYPIPIQLYHEDVYLYQEHAKELGREVQTGKVSVHLNPTLTTPAYILVPPIHTSLCQAVTTISDK